MNKRKIKVFVLFALSVLALFGCTKKDDLDINIVGLGGETWTQNNVDKWINDTLTVPYNMSIIYRWNGYEVPLTSTLVPPELNKVVPALRVVKYGWLDVYEKAASLNFIKTFAPRQYKLVGSYQYNTNGTVTLGEAEGGLSIVLYRINLLNTSDAEFVRRMLGTIHHEFTHILNQTKPYPIDFNTITTGYTSDWSSMTLDSARKLGFISIYSMDQPREDFAEMTSFMLTQGRATFDSVVNAQNPTAQGYLRKKESVVVNYFKDSYNIDFYALQAECRSRMSYILSSTTINDFTY